MKVNDGLNECNERMLLNERLCDVCQAQRQRGKAKRKKEKKEKEKKKEKENGNLRGGEDAGYDSLLYSIFLFFFLGGGIS